VADLDEPSGRDGLTILGNIHDLVTVGGDDELGYC
jgi:hypothetical protein